MPTQSRGHGTQPHEHTSRFALQIDSRLLICKNDLRMTSLLCLLLLGAQAAPNAGLVRELRSKDARASSSTR